MPGGPNALRHRRLRPSAVGAVDSRRQPSRLRLLPRTPYAFFVYWEVQARTLVETLRQLGPDGEGGRLVLRVDELVAGPGKSRRFDVEVLPGTGQCYLAVARDDTDYRVALGLVTRRGVFVPLTQYGEGRTPRARPSDDRSLTWYWTPPPLPNVPSVTQVAPHEPAPLPDELSAILSTWLEPGPLPGCESVAPIALAGMPLAGRAVSSGRCEGNARSPEKMPSSGWLGARPWRVA